MNHHHFYMYTVFVSMHRERSMETFRVKRIQEWRCIDPSVKNHPGDPMENEIFKNESSQKVMLEHEPRSLNHGRILCELPVKSTVYLSYGHLGHHYSGNTSHGQ